MLFSKNNRNRVVDHHAGCLKHHEPFQLDAISQSFHIQMSFLRSFCFLFNSWWFTRLIAAFLKHEQLFA